MKIVEVISKINRSLFQGGLNFEFTSLILNKGRGIVGEKSDDTDT